MSILAAFALAVLLPGGEDGIAVTRSLQVYAEASCRLARSGEASDARLEEDVYRPLSRQLLGEAKQVLEQPRLSGPQRKARQEKRTTYRNPRTREGGDIDAVTQPDEAMVTRAAGSVASVVIGNYRDAYRERHRDTPATPSFRDDRVVNRPRVTADIRRYCGLLAEMGITELFPRKQESRRPDAPAER